jgi:hypothetical protein
VNFFLLNHFRINCTTPQIFTRICSNNFLLKGKKQKKERSKVSKKFKRTFGISSLYNKIYPWQRACYQENSIKIDIYWLRMMKILWSYLRENNQLVNQTYVTIIGNLLLYIKLCFCKTIKSTSQRKIFYKWDTYLLLF